MKLFKWAFAILTVLTVGLYANAWAEQFGAPQPAANMDGWSIGTGYYFHQEKVEISGKDYTMKINQVYVQGTRSFGNFELYLRGGWADMQMDGFFNSGNPAVTTSKSDLDSDCDGFGTLGLKAFFPVDRKFGFGVFAQGTYYFTRFEDDETGYDHGVPFFMKGTVKNMTNVNVGASLQARLPYDFTVYAGPYAYWTHADVTYANNLYDSFETSLSNNIYFGGYAGASFTVKGLTINVEGRLSDKASGGAMLSYSF